MRLPSGAAFGLAISPFAQDDVARIAAQVIFADMIGAHIGRDSHTVSNFPGDPMSLVYPTHIIDGEPHLTIPMSVL